GLFVLALVFAAWAGEAAGKGRHSLAALWIAFLPLITLHLYFAAQENGRDLTGPFSRAGEVAEALEKTAPRPWYGFGSGVIALNPYFSAPPFANLAASPSYLTWTNPDSFRPNASIAAVEKGTVVWSDITDQE
ncbi:hypothetical protein, partial [Staphylococcus epidermidis]|uniref:hypothetical protein n=1 Tax=Staphylococcus epidermidis TaxID=1282 RepID=UPI0027399DBC